MSVILVTGANGQLGSELQLLSKSNKDTWVFSDVDTLDITNLEAVLKAFADKKVEFCINCAAYTNVDKAEVDEAMAYKINELGAENLAKGAAQNGAAFIQVSTDFVFKGDDFMPISESHVTNPISVYGKSKLAGEEAALENNPKTVIVRTSWLYSTFGANFVKTMIRFGKERELLRVISDQVGTPTYARDLASAILAIIEKIQNPEKGAEYDGIYHFSNEGVASWYDFAHAIFELSGATAKLEAIPTTEYPTPAERPHYSVMKKQKIKDTFGIQIPHWRDSLKACMAELEK
ncbi:dTDP-4-dehydrorhamnose reductase [Flammeovirgaceae bacterium SG7u.111]|nr:dTDP-4-dehydrorhamnose reductase [Flammeovirgaceae bacterium SG7u.132]WPO34036.1 dTDP-4-dehydrorhamnose reductase [Flammeovirgaceae bacterium SG7u.111]